MKKGRGAQVNPNNQYDSLQYERDQEYMEYARIEGEEECNTTKYIHVYPKTIVNMVTSPDVPMKYSMNPYQGCEHGCAYCYARPTHQYWGYNSGLEFENTILIKQNTPSLLEEKLNSKSWKATPIMLSGNTDCYQPAEKKYEITRALLQLFLKYKHPVGIITKNALILRDIDLLRELAKHGLVHVNLSITSLDEKLRRTLEPRTSTSINRLKTVNVLSKEKIPVSVMMAPIIPGLNSSEIHQVFKKSAEAGAKSIGHLVVRLNGPVQEVFENWVRINFPDRAEKVLNIIKEMHGGKLSDSRFKTRMKGEGAYARSLHKVAEAAGRMYFKNEHPPISLNKNAFRKKEDVQYRLFN